MMAEEAIDYDDEQDDEPQLKYRRILNGMSNIIATDAVSCMSVHEKFLAVGTHWGVINLLDHLGNSIESKKITTHCTTINQISIDDQGEYMASCSDDGRVVVHGLYSTEQSLILNFDRPVKAVAIAPDYSKSRQFVTGDDRLILVSKGFVHRHKTTILHQGEGPIRNIKWKGDFIAWANDLGVKVYDTKEGKVITFVTRSKEDKDLRPELYKCHIQWKNETTFIIGWGHTVQLCEVKQRLINTTSGSDIASAPLRLVNLNQSERIMPQRFVQISQYFTVLDYICGVSCIDNLILVLLYPCTEAETQGAQEAVNATAPRPQLLIAEPLQGSYREVCTDELPIRGFENHKCHNYHLESIPGENTHFIISPKDVVCGQERDADDHVEWRITNLKFEEALKLAYENEKLLRNHTVQSVGINYIDYLLQNQKFEEAGSLCKKVLKDKKLWEDQFYKFMQLGQLSYIAGYLPISEPRLDTAIYEMVLNEFLQHDLTSFLRLIKKWPKDIYNIATLIHAIHDRLEKPDFSYGERVDSADGSLVCNLSKRDQIIWESLALLYEYQGRYKEALSIYLRLKNSDVFELIDRHNLLPAIHEKLILLLELDKKRALTLLLENMNQITVNQVVKQLSNTPKLLYWYLDALYTKDTHAGEAYHDKLVELYATYNKPKLLPFLKSTDQYDLIAALNLCKQRVDEFIEETVYLLGRIGHRHEALSLIMDKLKSVDKAIAYCHQESEKELWKFLILHSTDKPDFITALLENSGMDIDPLFLIQKIQAGMKIPNLRDSLVKLLHDYQVQINLTSGCSRILQKDLLTLFNRQLQIQTRAIRINVPQDMTCQSCGASANQKSVLSASSLPSLSQDSFVIFYCKHAFHKACLSGNYECTVCETTT